MKIAVVGHVEHVVLGRVPALPAPGEIAHVEAPRFFPGGGGGVAFFQLTQSPAQILLYSALGNDEAADQVREGLGRTSARLHLAERDEPHTRDVVMLTPDGERTIVVLGEPLHPRRTDALPWGDLATCDAVYFTAQDPKALQASRAARLLIVTARRKAALDASEVRADVVVGSALDPRENASRAEYAHPPPALVLTEGARGGFIETASGISRFAAPKIAGVVGTYGAGDSFAGALVYFLASGLALVDACTRAGVAAAAVLGGVDPLLSQQRLL
jgi:ribokinase